MVTSQVIFNEKVYLESVLQRQASKLNATTGIVVGHKELVNGQTKFTIVDVLTTPSPTETGAGVEETKSASNKSRAQKNLVELLATNYDGFKYSDWVSEFNITVSSDHVD